MQRSGIVATMLFAIASAATAADSPLLEAVKNQDQQKARRSAEPACGRERAIE